MLSHVTLYLALSLYGCATLIILLSLVRHSDLLQRIALGFAMAGFASHTVFTGTICAATGHPPLTNLPEASAFIAWCIIALEIVLFFRFRVHAASFFVYPLATLLMLVT